MGFFEDKLLGWIESNDLFGEINRVLLAVSGGADSVAMAHVLHRLTQEGGVSCAFVIGHVNHCLRGAESDADEAFVTQLGQSLNIPVISQRVDVKAYAAEHKLSIETAGRVLRLTTLGQMAERNNCDCVTTAHHKDDLAETMVHRIMRGTGFRGLCGIWPVSEVYGAEFVRPMLGLRRAEIIQYCKDNSVQWRQDASNADVNFTRNHIRHRLLPILEDESDVIVDKLEKLSLACRRFQRLTQKQAQAIIDKGTFNRQEGRFSIKQKLLSEVVAWVFYEVVREVLVELDVGLRRYKREHFDKIRELIGKKRGNLALPKDMAVKVSDGKLIFLRTVQVGQRGHGPPYEDYGEDVGRLEVGNTTQFGSWRISAVLLNRADVAVASFMKSKDAYVEWFDAEKVVGSVEIRCRKDGDRFWPIGASGEKKVGRFLIDAQLETEAKQQAVVIKDTKKILWVVPVRMCEQAKVTEQTRKILEIRTVRRSG